MGGNWSRRAEEMAWLREEILEDFDSVVSAVEVLKKISDDLMAMRSTESSYTDVYMRSDPTDPITCSSPPMSDFSSSEKKHNVTYRYVEGWIRSLDDQKVDLTGPVIDPVGDHYDQMAEEMALLHQEILEDFDSVVSAVEFLKKISDDLMAMRSTESSYTDVYMRSDPTNPITCSSPPRLDDLIGPDIDPVGDHYDLMSERSLESSDSGVSLKSDQSKEEPIDFKDRVSPSMATRRPESIHSGVSLQSDWSKAEPLNFKDRVSPSGIITVTVTLAVAGLFISARCVR